ncbi:5'-methylthioadenosine/adenosylhomocysteine nucleosidase [Curvibacter sp. RS43]|uniref:5'-methylthioadenosine/adenosylhomocysteine nucleosidase n=1 Tax=Curvibacter microcysteis TaxID=3026419 RepID=UPI00235E2154|nr:5'-methylthioadenosine/adenosylhomocysteine nucleosidase [Curvibacter sp. RS43]MDD0810828.1 5'-methylthioadenosine/adenosylhomocysteine nucleosidase [Curvibacter sp. RS43]
MTLAILSALPQEQAGLRALLTDVSVVSRAGREFCVGRWRDQQDLVLALSRIGKVAAATTATTLIEHFGVTRMVFSGVAGGLGPGVTVGDVVVARDCLQHDMDASPLFPRHEVPLYARDRFACDADMAAGLLAAAQGLREGVAQHFEAPVRQQYGLDAMQVHSGLLISGDRFVSAADEAQALVQRLPQALAVEMEAAAVAQVCHDYGVPFAALRTISDRADDQAHVDFPAFLEAVAGRCTTLIVQRWLDAQAPA